MKLSTRLAAAAAALVLTIAACEDNPFITGAFAVDGTWRGSLLAGSAADTSRIAFDLELTQDRDRLSGSGSVATAADTFPVEVAGTWAGAGNSASVTLVLSSAEVAPLNFSGTFDVDTVSLPAPDTTRVVRADPDTLVGTLTGSALTGYKLTLGRVRD